MKFRFPIFIIDEDYRSENASGLGVRALASAIEAEGMEVIGVTSYGDLSSFAQQQSRASAFILSIDDEEFDLDVAIDHSSAIKNLRAFIGELRFRNADIPIYLYGETRTSEHIPNDILRELHGFIHMFEDTPEFVARHIIREARSYVDGLSPPFFKELVKSPKTVLTLGIVPVTRVVWPSSKVQWGRCFTSFLGRTCCALTSVTRSTNWANCSTTPALLLSPS